MGKKILIDSATMMNKALEIIEAHNLFDINPNGIKKVHPESIIHGVVVYKDGFNFAVLAEADMAIPISYALSWPERSALSYKLDLTKQKRMTFQEPDHKRFPALKLSMEVLNSSSPHTNSIVLNAANEAAVNEFLKSRIDFLEIIKVAESTIENFDSYTNVNSLSDITNIDLESRVVANKFIESKALVRDLMI